MSTSTCIRDSPSNIPKRASGVAASPKPPRICPRVRTKKATVMVAHGVSFELIQRLIHLRKILPGIELFSQGAATQLLSPLLRFTPEFEMDRCGSTAPWTPGKLASQVNPENCIGQINFLMCSEKKDFRSVSL